MKRSVSMRVMGRGSGTNLEFGGGDSVVKELIPKVQHQSDSSSHTTDSDGSLGSRVYGENDVRSETKHSSIQPVRKRQQIRSTLDIWITIPAKCHELWKYKVSICEGCTSMTVNVRYSFPTATHS